MICRIPMTMQGSACQRYLLFEGFLCSSRSERPRGFRICDCRLQGLRVDASWLQFRGVQGLGIVVLTASGFREFSCLGTISSGTSRRWKP